MLRPMQHDFVYRRSCGQVCTISAGTPHQNNTKETISYYKECKDALLFSSMHFTKNECYGVKIFRFSYFIYHAFYLPVIKRNKFHCHSVWNHCCLHFDILSTTVRTTKVWKSQVCFFHLFFIPASDTHKKDRYSSLSSCSPPSLHRLLAFFLHSLRPGSHYCFGKYFIGLNTFAHSHLPAASLTHRPGIDRSKWKRAKWKRRGRMEGRRSLLYLHFQWTRLLCSVSWLHNSLSPFKWWKDSLDVVNSGPNNILFSEPPFSSP